MTFPNWTDPNQSILAPSSAPCSPPWWIRKDQVEVDLVVTRGRQMWGMEVKASATVLESDGHGLRRLADQCGKDFKGGVLFHSGTSTLPMSDPRFLAVPLAKLWNM